MIAPEDSSPPDISTLDRFVKITTAAKLLGYANYQSVTKLSEDGKIRLYDLEHTRSKRVLLSDIHRLLHQKQNHTDSNKKVKRGGSSNKLGRPSKF
jgi:hypothetical protein